MSSAPLRESGGVNTHTAGCLSTYANTHPPPQSIRLFAPHLKSESTKVVRVFNSVAARSGYDPFRVRGLIRDSLKLKPERRITMTNIKNVVLVHGAFADGSGWKAVANILKNDGYKVSVPQPPETSYAEDQKYTKAAIDAMGGPVVLVGHSYGGANITQAGKHPNVAARG